MKRRKQFEDSSDDATVNLTPLIDVVFVVLIMFIIVAPMLELEKVALCSAASHPEKEMIPVQQNHGIAIHVRSDNSIWINHKIVPVEELVKVLKDLKKIHVREVPQLFHDKKAYFETYQSIKNAVEVAGFEELDVVLQPG